MPAPRAALACGTTAGGRVLLAGGVDDAMTPSAEIWLFEPYAASGTLLGKIVDSQVPAARWVEARAAADLPPGTGVRLELRVSDAEERWEEEASPWTEIAPEGAVPDALPRGRYAQWRARLSTTNAVVTPTLRSVSLAFVP